MCDPITLGISAALGIGGKLLANNEAKNNAYAQANASNAVLQDTLRREQGFADQNAGVFNKNVGNYAPGAQDKQLGAAQSARANAVTGNMTTANANDVPISADAPPAVRSEIAKRLLAVHDAAVSRAKANANLGGYGDTWLTNNLNTADADRNIGVTNNFANGQKTILPAMQQDAMAAAYKPPSIWSTILGGASSLAAGAAGSGGMDGFSLSGPEWGGGNFLSDAWGGNALKPLPGLTAADYG